jgi:hypothetical protein
MTSGQGQVRVQNLPVFVCGLESGPALSVLIASGASTGKSFLWGLGSVAASPEGSGRACCGHLPPWTDAGKRAAAGHLPCLVFLTVKVRDHLSRDCCRERSSRMVRAHIRILHGLLMTLNSHPDLWASSAIFQEDYVSTFPPDTST